jgi:acyl carrier protein
MELQEIKEITRKIIDDIIALNNGSDEKPIEFGDDDSLIDGGYIESLGAVQLIEECIQKFDILIFPAELSLENFDTLNRICEFIQTKLVENQQ